MEKPLFHAAFLFASFFACRIYSTSFWITHAILKSQRGKNKTSKNKIRVATDAVAAKTAGRKKQ